VIKNIQRSNTDDEPRLCDEMNEVNSAEPVSQLVSMLDNYIDVICTYMGVDTLTLRIDTVEDIARPVRPDHENFAIIVDHRYLDSLCREYEYYLRNVKRFINKVTREFTQEFLYNIHYKPKNMWEDAIMSYVACFSSSLRPLGACIGNLVIDNMTRGSLKKTVLRFAKAVREDRELIDVLYSIDYMVCDLVPMIFSEPLARALIINPSIILSEDFYRCLRSLIVRPLFEIVEMIIHELNSHVIDKTDVALDLLKVLLRLKSKLVKIL